MQLRLAQTCGPWHVCDRQRRRTPDQAAEFRDTHDTTDYARAFRTVRVVAELRNRHYEIPIEADVIWTLEARARKAGVSLGHVASDLLRRQLNTSE